MRGLLGEDGRPSVGTLGIGGVRSRFVMVGGLNTAVGLSIFPILIWTLRPLHVSYMLPLILSYPIGITFAYLTNKFITFRTKRNVLAEFSKFGTFYLLNFAVNLALLPMCVEWFHLPTIPSQLVIALLGMTMSYFWHSRITFRQGALPVEER
jgi:putative flippase GtrA